MIVFDHSPNGCGMMHEYILKASNIKKSFEGVQALRGVELAIKKGEIHCLAGENGSGKSTLIKIISGVYSRDGGEIEFNGKPYPEVTPIQAIMNGIQVIYQDLSIFPNMSVMENIAFNSELAAKKKLVNWGRFRKIAQEAIKQVNLQVDLDINVENLSIADKQQVAICRALINDAKLIIMDEPTTSLTKREVKQLFGIIKELQSRTIAILFISHKMDEIFDLSEHITILRNGENVFSGSTGDLDNKKFSFYMTGRKIEPSVFKAKNISDKPVFEVKNLMLENGYYDISFQLHRGEILGLVGLLGSGRTEIALSLFGIMQPDSGKCYKDGREIVMKSPSDAISNKICYVPEDRLTEGLFMERSIGKNITIAEIDRLANKIGILKSRMMNEEIDRLVDKLKIATPNPNNPVNTLSGGNQQRVVLAKWLALNMDVLILNGPTVGVDIGSKYDLHSILHQLAENGLSILIISDDIPEVLENCSRVLLMRGGRITDEIDPHQTNEYELSEKITMDVMGVNG